VTSYERVGRSSSRGKARGGKTIPEERDKAAEDTRQGSKGGKARQQMRDTRQQCS
jgi:hypothetical protein